MKTMSAILFLFVFITSCAAVTKQTITPFENLGTKEICVIDNPKVRMKNFRQEYITALQDKGYTVKVLDSDASVVDCKITSTYTARWSWDVASYMSYARIDIYLNGKKSAEARYEIVKEGATGKFIDAGEKIRELVDKIFPHTSRARRDVLK